MNQIQLTKIKELISSLDWKEGIVDINIRTACPEGIWSHDTMEIPYEIGTDYFTEAYLDGDYVVLPNPTGRTLRLCVAGVSDINVIVKSDLMENGVSEQVIKTDGRVITLEELERDGTCRMDIMENSTPTEDTLSWEVTEP